jgi:phage tail protein X
MQFRGMIKPAAGHPLLAYSSPEAVQTTGTVAINRHKSLAVFGLRGFAAQTLLGFLETAFHANHGVVKIDVVPPQGAQLTAPQTARQRQGHNRQQNVVCKTRPAHRRALSPRPRQRLRSHRLWRCWRFWRRRPCRLAGSRRDRLRPQSMAEPAPRLPQSQLQLSGKRQKSGLRRAHEGADHCLQLPFLTRGQRRFTSGTDQSTPAARTASRNLKKQPVIAPAPGHREMLRVRKWH